MSTKKDYNPLRYECFQPSVRESYVNKCADTDIKNYIGELCSLIDYQMKLIHEQRLEIVAMKHKNAWKQYDSEPKTNIGDNDDDIRD